MARASSDAVPVMDGGRRRPRRRRRPPQPPSRHAPDPRGPVRRQLRRHGRQRPPAKGLTFERRWTTPGHPSLRRDHLGDADRGDRQRVAASSSSSRRTSRSRSSGASSRRTSSSASTSAATSGRRSARRASAAHRPGRQHDRRLGGDPALLRDRRGPRSLPGRADPPPRPPEDGFNSPVWFNVGIEKKPQCSACFINSVQDTMSSIMDLAKTEAMLFKFGSGAGSNLSTIRSSKEKMTGGGTASGPGQLHEGLRRVRRRGQVGRQDAPRGQDGHPRRRPPGRPRLHRLEAQRGEEGLGPDRAGLRPELHRRGLRQRLLPERQPQRPRDRRVHAGRRRRQGLDDPLRSSTASRWRPTRPATSSGKMADAAWVCGDPGIQYDTTINDWHTSANTDRIYASNPCSEYMFLNDTACNLASLNLMKFVDDDGEFDVEALPLRGEADDHRPGDPRRQRVLPDAADRGEQPQVPAARPGLREPRRAADVTRPRLRLGRGPQLRRRADRDHARRGVQAVAASSPATTAVRSGPTTRTATPFLRVIDKHRDAAYKIPRTRRARRT